MLALLAVVAAAFLAGVFVGSAQAAASARTTTSAGTTGSALPTPAHHTPRGGSPAPSPEASAPSGSSNEPTTVPACGSGDVRTELDPWQLWSSIVLDTRLRLSPRDVPPDLVDTARAGLDGGHLVRAIVVDDLRAMARAARAAGAGLAIQSAYRSHAEQAQTFAYWVAAVGRREALGRSARPGHSEHQLGTTIDFTSRGAPPWAGKDWAQTDAGAWLARHAWQYGFVLSYPRGERDVTCYGYEPWHYRYVGRSVASVIHASGLPPREWLLR